MKSSNEVNSETAIITFLNDNLKNQLIPGYVASFMDNQTMSTMYKGYKAIYPEKEMAEENTIYDVASLTKIIVTTTLILQLVNEKEISLNDKISSFFPSFSDSNSEISDLLMHTSGLPADRLLDTTWSLETYREKVLSTPLVKNEKIYSDLGFIILGWIIEEVLEDTLENIALKRICQPLNLKDSGFNLNRKTIDFAPTEIRTTGLKRGTVHDRKATYLNGVAGHAGWFTTIADLNVFLNACLFPEQSNGVISENYSSLMNQYSDNVRTLGWEINTSTRPNKVLYHTGFTGVFMYIDINEKKSGAILTNSIHPYRNDAYAEKRKEFVKRLFK